MDIFRGFCSVIFSKESMMYRWNDELYIGNSVVDSQHKTLFKIAEKVETLMKDCRPSGAGTKDTARQKRVLQETIKYLKSYAIEHFAAEEAFQQEIGYERYEAHKKIHDNFIASVEQMEQRIYENDCGDEYVKQFLDWFSAWLYNHIMHEDQRIVKKQS